MKLLFKFFIITFLSLFCGCILSPLEYEEENNWTTYWVDNNNPNSNVFNVLVTSDNKLWAGTDNGVNVFDYKVWTTYNTNTTKNTLESNSIYSLAQGENGIWAGSFKGLFFFDYSTWKKIDSIGDTLVESLYYQNGNLWVGTNNGLFLLVPQGNGTKISTNTTGNRISAITSDQENMWVGTDNGLAKLYNGSPTATYTTTNGLSNNIIKSLASNGKFLWAGTANGLNRLDIIKNEWTNYTTSNTKELQSNDILALMLTNDILYAGTSQGLNKFDGKIWSKVAPDEISHVLSLAIQGNTLWVGTKNGILKGEI
ncbi:MAG: hypothetical protein AB1498_00015 [bacterium]